MEKRKKENLPLAVSVTLAMLAALSIVLGKYVAFNIGEVLRFSLENLPIIFAAVAFGPIAGMAIGTVADLVGCLMVGYTINPVVTLGAAVLGAVAGVTYDITKKAPRWLRVSLTVLLSHIAGSVLIKTVGLAAFYEMPFPILLLWRLLNYLLVGVLEGIIIYALTGNGHLMKKVEDMKNWHKNATRVATNGKNEIKTIDDALSLIRSVNSAFCNPGLERTRELTERLGSPEKNLRFIHVAGTNGKGSTSSMLASVLRRSGFRVGLYTSPYIYKFNERIRVGEELISDEDIIRLAKLVAPIAESMEDKPTEFEIITAIAFKYFEEQSCDVVVLEVGLGGRFDATNIIGAPLVSVITGISLDHTAFLGDTVEQIAGEKAGIIKAGAPVVYGGDSDEAYKVIKECAEECGSRLIRTSPEALTVKEMKLSGTVFSYKERRDVYLSLLGTYQTRNAMTVLDTLDVLRACGMDIPEEAILEGIKETRWSARFEILSRDPIVIYDGAHNPEGIAVATNSIKTYYPGGRVTVISGVLRDKDYISVAKMISEVADKVYVITPDSPRALPASEYREIFLGYGVDAEEMPSIADAVKAGVKRARECSSPLFSLGSLYTYKDFVDSLNLVLNE